MVVEVNTIFGDVKNVDTYMLVTKVKNTSRVAENRGYDNHATEVRRFIHTSKPP